tara:strand:- start:973 stop:1200 length:228 start_codon:yes stop_codon:yes gene_type:complete
MFKQILKNNFKYARFHHSYNGKDLYYPKYGNSMYEYKNYEIEKQIPYDGQPQITNVELNKEKYDNRIDYDCEYKK